MPQQRHALETQHTEQLRAFLKRLGATGLGRRDRELKKLMNGLGERAPGEATAKKAALLFLEGEASVPLKQEAVAAETVSDILDWTIEKLAQMANSAQAIVDHRRALLRDMAAKERQIDQKLAKTARTLEYLIAG